MLIIYYRKRLINSIQSATLLGKRYKSCPSRVLLFFLRYLCHFFCVWCVGWNFRFEFINSGLSILTFPKRNMNIMKTCPCNVYPLEPHFYIAKLGYAGVYLFFLFLLQNIDCGYSLEPPRRSGSNVYPQFMF